ncbi:ABA4-like family protein [Jiulongibacter sp. NS-SX5]|uniref:ABA4-like family protein n=1 Tax=Jiulongibacter sp. NS-SX5 TaxID=3463854 RepID=UPI0040586F07
MDVALAFKLVNIIALLSWIILIAFAHKPKVYQWLFGIVIAGLAATYAAMVFTTFDLETMQNFNSLEALASLNAAPENVLIGWIHYLAFDLLAGLYITKNGLKNGISRLLLFPCQLFTFMLGPFGVLLFMIVRAFKTKKWCHEF